MNHVELAAQFARRFAAAQEHDAALVKGVVEHGKRTRLGRRLEVNQQVSTGHEIQISEGRIAQHVVGRENDRLTNLRRNLKPVVARNKILSQALFANPLHHARGVDASTGVIE